MEDKPFALRALDIDDSLAVDAWLDDCAAIIVNHIQNKGMACRFCGKLVYSISEFTNNHLHI